MLIFLIDVSKPSKLYFSSSIIVQKRNASDYPEIEEKVKRQEL